MLVSRQGIGGRGIRGARSGRSGRASQEQLVFRMSRRIVAIGSQAIVLLRVVGSVVAIVEARPPANGVRIGRLGCYWVLHRRHLAVTAAVVASEGHGDG